MTDEQLHELMEAHRHYSAAAEVFKSAHDEITRLREERDEARREVCGMNESGLRMNDSDKQREAKRRGWDCFKEAR